MTARVIHADCLDAMRAMPDASIDAIVTDPPYGLSFMGRDWDHGVPGPAFWIEALRVAKPGAHLVAFGGTRTYHRLACAIEDAGWEIRDCLSWLYGSGFPKSLDVSKAIDRAAGAERKTIGSYVVTGTAAKGKHKGRVAADSDEGSSAGFSKELKITAPATDAARQWQGWGTALKPAWEPCILARKPLDGTVAANVTAHGTGAINVDACRIGWRNEADAAAAAAAATGYETARARKTVVQSHAIGKESRDGTEHYDPHAVTGRWPANVALDEEATAMLGEPARFFYTAKASRSERFAYLTCDCETVNIEAWVNEDQSQHAQTVVTSPQMDISEELLRDVSDSCTLLSGNDNTGRFQRDFKSTTSTTINSTIDLKISSLSLPPSTSASIADANCEATSGGNHADCVDSKNQSTKRTGTSRPKVGRCTGAVVPATSARLSNPSVCVRCGAKVRIEAHPTQKPVALMRWLVRMVTPPGGVVLDPFCGSGTTLVAAIEEGFDCIGIEREAEYVAIIEARVAAAQQRPQRVAKPKPKRQPVKVQPAATAPPTPIVSAPLPGQLALAWGAE